jgi:hypothetical protein
MTEYLSKKAVLEHIRREIGITEWQRDAVMTRYMKEFHGGAIRALQNLEHAIQSGAFDANGEVQRLKVALAKAKGWIKYFVYIGQNIEPEMEKKAFDEIDEILSGARDGGLS